MRRTDIHRPSSPDFDPEAYSFIGIIDLNPQFDEDGNDIDDATTSDVFENIVSAMGNGYNFAPHVISKANLTTEILLANISLDSDNADLYEMKNCGHCGARIRYAGVLTHKDSREIIYAGEECLSNRFHELSKAEFQRLREQAKLNRDRMKKQEKIDQIIKDHPMLGEDTTGLRNHFLSDIQDRLERTGKLSDKQITAFEKALPKAKEWKVQRDIENANSKDAPTGRVEVTGKILKIKDIENDYFNSLTSKMTLQTTDGWKLWVTVPESLYNDCGGFTLNEDTISMTVDITPSKDDSKFAFGKRPTKAKIVHPAKYMEVPCLPEDFPKCVHHKTK